MDAVTDCGCNFCLTGERDGMGHDDGEPQALPPDHPDVMAWVERIARGSTPVREYDEQGRFAPWIRDDLPVVRRSA